MTSSPTSLKKTITVYPPVDFSFKDMASIISKEKLLFKQIEPSRRHNLTDFILFICPLRFSFSLLCIEIVQEEPRAGVRKKIKQNDGKSKSASEAATNSGGGSANSSSIINSSMNNSNNLGSGHSSTSQVKSNSSSSASSPVPNAKSPTIVAPNKYNNGENSSVGGNGYSSAASNLTYSPQSPSNANQPLTKFLGTGIKLSNNNLDSKGCWKDFKVAIEGTMENPRDLTWLDLSFNSIGDIDKVLLDYEKLQVLYLHANAIKDVAEINKLQRLPNLRTLTLHGNPIENIKNYRWEKRIASFFKP